MASVVAPTLLSTELTQVAETAATAIRLHERGSTRPRPVNDCGFAATSQVTNGGKGQFGSTFRLCFWPNAAISQAHGNDPLEADCVACRSAQFGRQLQRGMSR